MIVPDEFRPSLLEAAKKAEDIFHSSESLDDTKKHMVKMLVGLVHRWNDEGLIYREVAR